MTPTRTRIRPSSRVVSIRGNYVPDVIKQVELEDAYTAYLIHFEAARRAQIAAIRIEGRILSGASIEPGGWGFDREMRLVIAPGYKSP